MRVIGLELTSRRSVLARPLETSKGQWSTRDWLIVTVLGDSGAVGVGEAAPLPGRSRETLAQVQHEFVGLRRDSLPLQLDLRLPAAPQVQRILERTALSGASGRFAFETALLDLAGRALGTPVSTLLTGRPAAAPVAINALLPAGTRESVLDEAQRLIARGFTTFKVKIGRPGRRADEQELLASLRRTLGAAVRLRADANGAWSAAEARSWLAELAPLDLEFVEQPVSAEELLHFGAAPVPVAADESLALPGALEELIVGGACRAVVLKPMLLGGALPCLELARRASGAGMDVVVTGLWDGPIAAAAAGELALALDPPPLACGLSPAVGPGAEFAAARSAYVPHDRPGLGLFPQDLGS